MHFPIDDPIELTVLTTIHVLIEEIEAEEDQIVAETAWEATHATATDVTIMEMVTTLKRSITIIMVRATTIAEKVKAVADRRREVVITNPRAQKVAIIIDAM
jgi:hypothetical protein